MKNSMAAVLVDDLAGDITDVLVTDASVVGALR